MRVSVIIPAWNMWEYTLACLRSLAAHDERLTEIVVVDNGSTDDTCGNLQPIGSELFGSRFIHVRHERNLGFASACNAGANASSGDILFFLNNDTTVTHNWLSPLLEAISNKQIGAVGPRLLYPDGTCQHCGIGFTPFLAPVHIYANFAGNCPALFTSHTLKAITGAALMVRRQQFFTAGCFKTDYRNGFEDLDLCYSLRNLGGTLTIASDSVIIHYEGKTPGRHQDDSHNSRLFTERWGNIIRPDLHTIVSADNYDVQLGPQLKTYVAPNAQKQNALAKLNFSKYAEIEKFLEREPLWESGYVKLIHLWEQQQQFEKALSVAQKLALFFPLELSYRTVLRCAKQINNEAVINDALGQLTLINSERRNNKKKLLFWRQQTLCWGDATLTAIYDDWLKKYDTK